MRSSAALGLILLAVPLAVPFAASAQARAAAEILLPDAGVRASAAPTIRSRSPLSGGSTESLLQNGFPARMHFRLERWKVGRWFDDLKATAEWDVVVRYDALAKLFQVYRVTGPDAQLIRESTLFADANSAAGSEFAPTIAMPKRGERSYYSLVIDIETLSMTDLDEVERWLRGEAKPAIRGKRNPGTAVSRGVGTLFVRLLGGDKRRLEARSGKFVP